MQSLTPQLRIKTRQVVSITGSLKFSFPEPITPGSEEAGNQSRAQFRPMKFTPQHVRGERRKILQVTERRLLFGSFRRHFFVFHIEAIFRNYFIFFFLASSSLSHICCLSSPLKAPVIPPPLSFFVQVLTFHHFGTLFRLRAIIA